jgi:hypothetical protein
MSKGMDEDRSTGEEEPGKPPDVVGEEPEGTDADGRQPSGAGAGSDPPPDDGEAEHSRLQSLFVDLTGTEKLVEKREPMMDSRCLGEGATVSDYVTEAARNDGLDDAVDEFADSG